MIKKQAEEKSKSCNDQEGLCCCVEAVVSVDERGQMVLPKELRDRIGIRPGDKMAVISQLKNGRVCCLSLIKADAMSDAIRKMLGPIANEVSK